jgi:hypothetical protein
VRRTSFIRLHSSVCVVGPPTAKVTRVRRVPSGWWLSGRLSEVHVRHRGRVHLPPGAATRVVPTQLRQWPAVRYHAAALHPTPRPRRAGDAVIGMRAAVHGRRPRRGPWRTLARLTCIPPQPRCEAWHPSGAPAGLAVVFGKGQAGRTWSLALAVPGSTRDLTMSWRRPTMPVPESQGAEGRPTAMRSALLAHCCVAPGHQKVATCAGSPAARGATAQGAYPLPRVRADRRPEWASRAAARRTGPRATRMQVTSASQARFRPAVPVCAVASASPPRQSRASDAQSARYRRRGCRP